MNAFVYHRNRNRSMSLRPELGMLSKGKVRVGFELGEKLWKLIIGDTAFVLAGNGAGF